MLYDVTILDHEANVLEAHVVEGDDLWEAIERLAHTHPVDEFATAHGLTISIQKESVQ